MNNLQAFGIDAVIDTEPNGRLHIDLVTNRDVRVTVNGQPIKADAGAPPTAKFWTADGKQTDQPPVDLRGEER